MYLPASAAAINSALVELCATVSWYFVLYNTVPPAICILIPITNRLWVELLAWSESTNAVKSLALSVCSSGFVDSS